MATVCLTGETMKKAIRSAPNQTKITLVPSLKKESSFELFEAFEVGINDGATFQNIPYPPFWLRTCAFHIYKNLFHLIGKSCRKFALDILKSVDFMEISNQRRYIRA